MPSWWPPAPPPVTPRAALPEQPVVDRIKVLHVITRFIAGSGGNTLVSAAGMDPRRYETWVAGMPGGPLFAQARAAGVHTVDVVHMRERISPWHDLLACVELVHLIRRERFTVVHTHCSKAGLIGRVAAWLTRTPVVVHTFHILAAHEGLSRARRAAYLFLERRVRPCAHHYVAVAPRVAREAVEQRIARPGRISVVPSAVEIPRVARGEDAEVKRELGIAPDAPVVGTVGRIVAQKAPLDFVRMCGLIHAQRPDVAFVLVGDADLESHGLEDEVRAEADRLDVPIVFTGFRPDAPRVASAFDVYVVPSLWEGLGRAVTEALALARPVVATAVNGVPDLVEPGATGLLARPGDPASLAGAVAWMLDHPREAAAMGAQGRARVLAGFTPQVMCDALDRLYGRLLGLPEPIQTDVRADAGKTTGLRRLA